MEDVKLNNKPYRSLILSYHSNLTLSPLAQNKWAHRI